MEEALEHLNQHSYTTEKCDATGSDSLQNSRPDKTNPFCETVKDAEMNSILRKTTNIENLTSVTVEVMGNDEGELFGEKPLRVEDSLQDTSKDSDVPSGDANPYKLRKEDKVVTEEINDKEDLLRDRNLNLDISASPNDISQETCSETHELTSEGKNDEADDVGLKIPLVHSSSIAESGIVFSEKDHDGLTSRQRQGPDEECNKMEMENVTDEEAATDKFTTEEEVIVPKYVNEGMNTETGENIGTEVAEEKNKDEDILIHEYKNQRISDLREGKCSASSIVHIDAVSPESTDGVEIVEESIEDNATKKIGNDVSSKEAAPQYGEIFSEKLEKGNSVSDEKYFKLASSQDDPETGPTGISTVKVEAASEENIMSETDKDQLEVTTAKLAEYALDEQNICTASVAEDPTTKILQTGDSVNAHTVENSDQMLHEHNHETATERQIVEKDGTFSEIPMPENSENFVAKKDVKLENLFDEVDKKKHEKITDNVPDKHCFQDFENTTESEELESAENRSNVGDKISTSEITGRNVIDEQETYSGNEKGDSIVKEVGSDNVIFTYHSAAQLIEKVHPINEEESKKLDEISDVMYDDGLSCEKVPDKADANRQILKCDMLDISKDPVCEGLMENEKSTENLESISEDTYTETIANIGATNNGSGNEGDDDLSIVEASGLGKEPGAPDVKISMETEELRGNSNPEKESTDMVPNVKERSQEDEKTSEVEKVNGKESTQEDEKLDIASEPAPEDQAGETNSKATTNIHDLIDENHPEEENIKTVNQYDEPETAKSKDEDNKEMYVSDDSDSYELAKGKMDEKGGKQHEEKAKFGCEEKTYQTMNVGNNEVNIQEEKTDMEKLSVSEDKNEETSGESVGTNIHYSIDNDKPEKEIITINQNDESETEKLKDDDIKEMNVGEFSDSHELAETITQERVGKRHEETANSGYEEKINQVEYINETIIQEEKTHIVKLEINSEPISKDQIEEINSELVATNIQDLIDDGNQEKKQNIEMVNLDDEPEAAKLKDEDNKEIYVGDISGSYELAERTIHDKIGKRHVEKMNSGGEEEICQAMNVKNNGVDIPKEKIDREKVGIISETVSGNQIEESQETVATNILNSIGDDNPEKEQNIKTVTLNDDPETTKLKDEDNKEMFVGDISDSYELAEGTTHNKVGKWHEETSNSGCEKQTCQTVNVENNEVHIQEEKTESEKREITSEAVSEDQIKESHEISQESVATNSHDSINDDNPEKEIIMINKNYESETAKLKDDENNEMNVCNHSDSHELDEEKTREKVGKQHQEITNSGCEEETSQMLDVNNNDETDIVEENTNIEKLRIDSESISGEQTEVIKSKLVATNNHGSIDNDNQELKKRIKNVNLNDEPETARLTDEENKEMYDGNVSDSFELAEGTTHNKVGKWHEETSNSRCEEETCQKVDVENNNEVDIQEEKRDSGKLGITSKTVSNDQFEQSQETSQESGTADIHDSVDDANSEKEIITVNQKDESEMEKLKDDDIKEMNVGDISDSHELAETTTHETVGKWHEETANSGCEEEADQVEDIEETNVQEEKTYIKKLEINSEPISEDQIEEINCELVASNIHDLIDDGNQEKKQNIEMVNLNDEPESAKLKDEDNKEIYVGDISDSYELAEGTIHDKVGKWYEEKTNSGGEEETCQAVNVENNKVDIQKEKIDSEKVGITSETVSGDQIEESQETRQETVATNIHNTIDDDNPEKEQNIKTVTLNDDPETIKLKDEDNKEMFVGDISDSYELAEGTTHNKVGKWHEETSNSGCEEQTCQTVNVENNEVHIQEEKTESEKLENTSEAVSEDQIKESREIVNAENKEVHIQEEKTESEKLEITSDAVSEDRIKESREISQESVATNIHDSINDDNPEKEIIMVNKNYESETAKLKDDENNETNVCNHSDSHEFDEEKTQEKVGKRHGEITNSGCEEETSQMLDVNDNDETDIVEEKTNIEKLGINSESISGEQTEEIKSKLVATNNHGSIDNDNQELKQRIQIVNLNDEPETARLTDEENKEMYDGNVSDSFELAEGTTHNKVGKWHEETSNSSCEEETCQKVDVENNNEVDIQEEKRDSEKLGITSKMVSDDQFELNQETSQESVAADIHDSVDDANSEKEIITVNQNDESEMEKLKDADIKEMNVGNISDSHELAETTHETVGKQHEETANSGCEEETDQVEDIEETNIQEEKTYIKKLEINSEPISEDQIEEINCELVATNIHDLIDDGNQEKKQNIEMVNLNDEPETAKLKDEDNKEIYVGDISGSYELAEGTIHDKVGKRHEEKTNSGGEEETCQAVNVENNKVDIQKEKIDSEKVGITSETVSGDQIEESQETRQETVATNIHNSIDDDNPEKEQNIKMITLNDDPETAKLKDEDNKEIYVSDVADSYELAEGTTHNKVGKWHEETSNSGCEEETCQMENVENNNEVDIQEEKTDSEKLEITSETISEDQIEEGHEISQESVAPNIHDSINVDNPEKEIIMVNKNYEAETVKLKDDDNKEMNVGDLSDSHELNKETTHERVGKWHEEIANSGCDKETCQILDVDNNNETDIVEEKTNIEKLGIDSESTSGEETEEIKSELVATNIHGSIDDDNQELKQNIRRVNQNDEPESAMLTDEDNKEMYVGDASDSFESAEATRNKIGKWHEETSNSGCEEETCQKVNVENNKVDIQEEKTDSEKLGITPETISDDQIEESQETSQESVAADIHDSVDDNSERENIKIVIRNDEAETAKLKDEDNKEMDVGDVSDSYELAEGTTHKKVGKWHEESSNSGCGKETCQLVNVENSEVDIQEEKADSEKLEIASEMVSEDQTEESQETCQESGATNTGDLIDDDNSEKQITVVNQNVESETAKLKNDDNKEMNVGDISDSHELAKGTTQERTGKRHEEITNSGCEEETHQMLDIEDNEIDIEEEKREMGRLGTDSESISGEQIEEINSELVATNIHGLIDDDNQQLKIFKMVDEELETAKLKDEHNNKLIIGDTLDSHQLVDRTIHERVDKWHKETSYSRCEEDVHQTMNREDNYDLDIQDEKTDNEKLEITSESISENKIEETNCESVTTNIGDVIYKSNQEAEIIRLVNLNDEPETAKLKDEDIKEMSIDDISDSRELAVEITIHDRVGKLNEETTNSGCQEETHQMKDAKESNEVDNQEETTNTEKYEITSETVSEEQIEETNIESVVTNFHDLTADDDNPEKEIVEVANLNVEPETVKLKDDNNKQMNVSDISDSCELSQKTIYHSIGKQQEEPTNSGCEEETYEVINAEDKNEVDNLEDKMDAEKFAIATESGSKEKNSESVTTTIHDSVEDEKTENKQNFEMVCLNDNPGTEKVKEDDNKKRNNGDISDKPKSFEGTKHDRVDNQHKETTYTAGEEDIKQSSDSNNATEVAVDEEGAGTKKLELISDTMSENQEQYATYEAENAQMESTVGDCTSSNTTGILPISDIKYEDKVQEAGPVPNLSSSEVRKSIDHQISGNKRTYETLVSSLEEDVIEKAYKLDSQEKPKVFSMDEKRDENLSKKEQIPETIIKNPSSNVSERLEESAEVFGQRQITEDGAIMDDDSVSVRCEPVKETCPDKEEFQMIEEEIPESTYRDQGDESDEKDDKKSSTYDKDGSLSHLNEERENVNVDDEESRNKRFDNLPVGTILTGKAGLQSDQRESTSKPEDMKDMILNEEILEARIETEADKNMIPEDTYKTADTETLKTNDEESISKNVENSSVMPTPVGETSEEIEESHDKALHYPHEKQIHQGISEIDSNITGSGVIEEDITEGTLSVSVKGETNKHFSAEGNDRSHQEREGSKSTQVKLLEEAKAIDEAGFVPSKQALDTEVDKLNDECGLVCKENLKSNESEKNQEEEETVKEKEMDVCLDTSSNKASEKSVVAAKVESPCEQIEAATEAVKGIDKVAAESISISHENFKIKAGESSIEGGDKKNCDPAEDFHSTKESSAEKKLQNNTFEDKFEGLDHGVSKEQTDISEDNTNKEQDSWESSETKELEDEIQDEGNEIREEKEVSQTINMGESNQNESSEEKENSEKFKLEDVEIENTFSIVQEGVQTESGNCNRERLDKEDTDVNSEKIFHEDENNKDEEATVEMASAASETAEGATSDELQELKSMTACEKAEDMDATNEKTEKMVDGFPDTDSTVELVRNVEASGSHSQMHKIELPTLESTKERFQSMGTGDEGEDERCEELNTKLQEDSKELIEYEHQSAIVLEGAQQTGPSEKIEEKIIIEQDISEAPHAWLKEETEDEQLQKDEIETQNKKELQTECETETNDILATDSSKEEGKEYGDAQSQNFPTIILTYEEDIASPVTKLEENKNIDATPEAYIETETAHEQFQKDHIEAENDKPQDEQELETTCIMANESPNDEVKEFACKPSGHNSMSNLNFKIEDENKNLDGTPGACVNNETSHKRLQKDEVSIVKKEPQTTEDKSPNNNVMECDCILSEQNSVMTVLTEETETTLPKDVQGEKKCSDATMNACMQDEQLQKDGIEAEKNNEPETRWEMQTTDARANKSANYGATEFDSSPSENTFMTVFTDKIRGALLLTGENEKKNLDITPSYCVKNETNHEQFQKNNTDSDKYEEPYDKWKVETTHVTKNESPNNEVKELDSISSEQDSLSAVLTEKIKTALSMGRMDEKKNTDADPGTCMKVKTTNEQFKKDGTSVENIKEPQANESPNYEVNKLDCIPSDENSVTILSTDHLETALLMDEGNEKKNLDALSLTGSAAEGIVHEVAQKNVVSNSMLSKHTEDKATVVELAKETCIEDLIEVHKLDYSSIDSGSLDEAIDAENITVDLSARGEEVPEWATDAVQVSEDSRIETLNQEDREKIGKASRLVSKMEVDETNFSSVTLTEDEVKTRKSSTEQTTEARSPVERECMKHTEEDSNEVLESDNSQNEEKRQDSDDLPVSRLLLEHILRNNSDMQDQTYDAVVEEKGQEYNNKISNHATTEKQGVSLSAELEETQKKLEDPSILSQEESIHDEEDNTANAAVKEEETPQSIMKYASPSLPKSEDITDNEHISKYEDITASLPTKIVTEETRISEDRSDAENLENASDLKIDEVNQDKKNMGISEVTDDKEQNNIQNSSINAVVDGVKDEIPGLLYEASTHDVKIRNGSMKMTSDDPSGPNNNSQATSVKTMTGNPENLNKDVEASFITKSSEDNILQDEGDEDGKVISEDLDKFENISHTKTEEKTRSHSETVQYMESLLQSEKTVPSSQYNQTAKSSESSISEIHNHEQKEAAASEIKSEDKNEEFGKESHHEIAEIVQNVNNDSPEGSQIPDSPQVQESKLILESANEPVQIAARSMDERSIEISNDEKQIKAASDTQIEEDNTDEEKEENEHKIEEAEQDVKVNVEARDANSKKAHKKSHNILSGVGSKVKHSLAKVKKAITGKSSQPKATSPK